MRWQRVIAFGFVLVMAVSGAFADWRQHDNLPPWAQRGRLRWTLMYGAPEAEKLQLTVDARQTLLQGPTFAGLEPGAQAVVEAGGLHDMKYVPRTWEYDEGRIFDEFPYLRDAEAKKADGSRYIYYHEGRYTGCENQPGYVRHRKRELAQIADSDSIFFDSTSILACHCDVCKAKFRKFSEDLIGRELELPTHGRLRRETLEDRVHKLFCIEKVVDYFDEIRSFLSQYDPAPLICPNLHIGRIEHQLLMMRGVPDLVFFEESGHPPMTRKYMGYKIALALTHGRPVGQLIYLTKDERARRGWKFISTADAGRAAPDWMAYIVPDELAAATAEAVAAGGDYIEGYSITPMYSLTDPSQPMVSEDLAAINKYSGFLAEHEDLLADALPGSRLGVFYSVWTGLWHLYSAQQPEKVADKLFEAGLPFELLVEDDLKPEILADYRVILVPNAICVSRAAVEALAKYVEGGGALLITENFATEGWLDPNKPEAPEIALTMAGGDAGVRERGAGKIFYDPRTLHEIPADELLADLKTVAGERSVEFSPGGSDLVVNVMRSGDGRALQAHIVNYDFEYGRLWPGVADDDGGREARIPFVDTELRARKILELDDPSLFTHPTVTFSGSASYGENYSLVISLNGQEVATLPASECKIGGWIGVPVEPGLLKRHNEVIIRAIGSPNADPDYFNLGIDTGAEGGKSFASEDGGQTWSSEDLSPFDEGDQRGEYMIRLAEQRDEQERIPVQKLLDSVTVNPTEAVSLTVRDLPEGELQAVGLSPEHAPERLEVRREGDAAVVTVPPTRIWELVVVSADAEVIEGLIGNR